MRLSFRNNPDHYCHTYALTNDTHAVFSLFLDQNTWCDVLEYIHLQPLTEDYGFFCKYLLLSEDRVHNLLCLSYTVLCLGHKLSLNPWWCSDTWYWAITHSPYTIQYQKHFHYKFYQLAINLYISPLYGVLHFHFEKFHEQNSPLRPIMSTSIWM